MVYFYLLTSREIAKEHFERSFSVRFSLSTDVSFGVVSMKIVVAFVVIFVIGICDGQTNPIAGIYGRGQRVGPVCDSKILPFYSFIHHFSLDRLIKKPPTKC